MLLAIDVGNTHVVLGLYRGDELVSSWRLQSEASRTVDEFSLAVLSVLQNDSWAKEDIKNIVLSCVVPALSRVFVKLSRKYFGKEPLIVGPGLKTGMRISVDDPRTVGADRIVNAIAAKELYGAPVIVVDFGTATTFDVVGASGAYEGGVIAPGLVISAEALSSRAAQLPSIELSYPDRLIGKNTRDSMLSGIVYGYVGLVDGILKRIKAELGVATPVIATGGLAHLIVEGSDEMEEVSKELTLRGLRLIAEMNTNAPG